MQYQHHEEDQQVEGLVKNIEQRLELSAAWRALLGLEASASDPAAAIDPHGQPPVTTTPVLANDPWSALLQTQGVQVIDLQQLHKQAAQPSLDEWDVERALNHIQEQPS
jgi:hypothetical protein